MKWSALTAQWSSVVCVAGLALTCHSTAGQDLSSQSPISGDRAIVEESSNSPTSTDPITNTSNANATISDTSIPCEILIYIENVSNFSSRLERTLRLQQDLAKLPINSLHKCLNQSKTIQSASLQEEVQSSIIQRMAVLNPIATAQIVNDFATRERGKLTSLFYGEWSFFDLTAAVEHAKTLPIAKKRIAAKAILVSRDDLAKHRLVEIAKQLNSEDIAIDVLAMVSVNVVRNVPEDSWNSYIAMHRAMLDNATEGQIDLLSNIGVEWIETEGLTVIDEIEKSLMNPRVFNLILTKMVWIAYEEDPNRSLEIALKFSPNHYPYLARLVVESWSTHNPISSLNAISAIEKPGVRRILEDSVITKWARSNPASLLAETRNLSGSLRLRSQEAAMIELAQVDPFGVYDMLNELSSQASKIKVLESIVAGLAIRDFSTAIDWVKSKKGIERYQDHLMEAALRSLAHADPDRALQVALDLPPDDASRGLEAQVISWVSLRSPDSAVELLGRVRNDETRIEALRSLVNGYLTIGHSERAVELVLETLQDVPVDAGVRNVLWELSWQAPEELFNVIDELQSDELRVHVAQNLLMFSDHSLVLSFEQIGQLRQLAPEPTHAKDTLERVIDALEVLE